MKTQAEKFVQDRVAEVVEFVTQLRLDHQTKCAPADWHRILEQLAKHFQTRLKKEHLLDPTVVQLAQKLNPVARHTCHWPGCKVEVPPKMWGCANHWFTLPLALRRKVWATFVPGQEVSKTPSAAYLAVAAEIQAWIARGPQP